MYLDPIARLHRFNRAVVLGAGALERKHLIETQTDPADRRRSIARLTPKGQAEVASHLAVIHFQASGILASAGARAGDVLACRRACFAELAARVPSLQADPS